MTYYTTKEVCELLHCKPKFVRSALGEPDIKKKRGAITFFLYGSDKVRDYINKPQTKRSRQLQLEKDPWGVMVKPKYRGSKCRRCHEVEVPTGQWFCKRCRDIVASTELGLLDDEWVYT
jgi:hypothetical protein